MNYQTLKTYTQGLLSIFKKDWKENNPSSIEYIKNRPFFIEDGLEEKIIFSLPLTIDRLPNEDNNYYQYEWLQISSQNIDIKNNDIFFIKIDNDIKELNVFTEDGTYIMLIGNSEEDCEFFMKIIPYGERFNIGDIKSKIKINHIVLFQKVEKIHYLDSKYLNNDIARTSDLNNKLALSAINPHGTGSFAVGYNVHANGDYSHAEGMSAEASGDYSHAEGYKTKADGYSSHAEGYWTCANGDYSHAEGQHTEANGDYSHAEGWHTEANGYSSHAEGYYTEANGNYSHVQGKYNIIDTNSKYVHIVGNGTESSKRSNAHTLDWDGNAWFAGDVYVGETNTRLAKIDEIPSLDNYYTKDEVTNYHEELEAYTDHQVAALVNSAPETLDTIGELAAAFKENQDMVATLNAAIVNKAENNEVQNLSELVGIIANNVEALQAQLQTFKTETWNFTLEDGTVITKKVVIKD